ncbi:MAG TPA: VWA domain-containing protein [Acidobacteriaceae bacterium]
MMRAPLPGQRRQAVLCSARGSRPALLLCLLVAAGNLPAQRPAGEADQGVRAPAEISLQVLLESRKDKPVDDLKASDIKVSDAGRRVDARELRITSAPGGDELVTLIFDQLDPAAARNAARAARTILKDLGDPRVAVSVWSIEDRFRMEQAYTRQGALVDAAIGAATAVRRANAPVPAAAAAPAPEGGPVAGGPEGANGSLAGSDRRWELSAAEGLHEAQRLVEEQHAPPGTASLMAIARTERDLPGRKAVLYFTQSVPSDLSAADLFKRTSEYLRDAGISLYAINMNAIDEHASDGLVSAMAMGSVTTAARTNKVYGTAMTPSGPVSTFGISTAQPSYHNDPAGLEFSGLETSKNLLAQLAESSGGKYDSGDGNLKKIARQLGDSLTSYYTLTYPVDSERMDGSFHAVSVVPVRPGLRIKAQPGYFASRPGGAGPGALLAQRGGELERLESGATPAEMKFDAAVLRFGQTAGGVHSVIALELPIDQLDLHLDADTDLVSLHCSVAAEVVNSSGATVARFVEEVRRHGSADNEERLRTQFVSVERAVSLPAGPYRLNLVVRDWNAGTVAKRSQPIELTAIDDPGLMSDLVLVRSTEQASGEARTLRYRNERVVPNLSGRVAGDGTPVYFQIYSGQGTSRLEEVHLEVSKDGRLLHRYPVRTEGMQPGQGASLVIPVKLDAGAGSYDVALCLARGGHTLLRHLAVASVAADAASSASSPKPSGDLAAPAAEAQDFAMPSMEADTPRPPGPGVAAPGRTLSADESRTLILAAQQKAMAYTESLPNFMCAESIERTVDRNGSGVWKHRDSIVELLKYHEHAEKRTLLELNGERSGLDPDQLEGARSNGEFGGILASIFDPAAGAKFEWLKSERREGGTLQVFSYKVPGDTSLYFLTDHSGARMRAGIHGEVFIDEDTHAVRRLVANTDPLPGAFGIRSSWMWIDYDYVAINGHDYLLPSRGEVGLKQGRHQAIANRFRFSDYRRFGSRSRIVELGANAPADPAGH